MYSEKLESLIKNILADGEITEKERAVLHKCAETEGVDANEIDVYIDGELDKIRNDQQKAKAKVRKCPACGEIIPVLSIICPSCGSAIQDDYVQKNITTLADDFQEIKGLTFKEWGESFTEEKAKYEKDIRTAKILCGENSKVSQLIIELQNELDSANASFKKWKKFQHLNWLKLLILFIFMCTYIVYSIYKYGTENVFNSNVVLVGLGVLIISSAIANITVYIIKSLNIGDRN